MSNNEDHKYRSKGKNRFFYTPKIQQNKKTYSQKSKWKFIHLERWGKIAKIASAPLEIESVIVRT